MDAKAVIAISGAVVMLLQVLKAAGLAGRWALVVSALLSILGVYIWGYSAGAFSRAATWDYFAGWIAVFSSAAGVFGIVNGSADAVTSMKGAGTKLVAAIKGTGDGTGGGQ